MAHAYMQANELAHRRSSWFVGHLIAYCGMFKDRPNIKRLIADLNAPVEKKAGEISLSSLASAELVKKTYGIDLLPND